MKRLALAATMIVAAVGLVVAVLVHRGKDALQKSDQALERGDLAAAIVFAERAAQARLPLSPYPEAGYLRLLEIAEKRVAENDDATAKLAYGAVLRANRTTGEPDAPHANEATAGLAKIDARSKTASGSHLTSGPVLELAPPPRARFALAASVVVVAAALVLMSRGARYAWPVLAVGLVSLLFVALQ